MIANIGGVFLHSNDPKALAQWYTECLGVKFDFVTEGKLYGLSYLYNERPENHKRYIVFSISKARQERPEGAGSIFDLNLRVENLEAVLDNLKAKGVEFKAAETHPEGNFAWVKDPDDNSLELWQDLPPGQEPDYSNA